MTRFNGSRWAIGRTFLAEVTEILYAEANGIVHWEREIRRHHRNTNTRAKLRCDKQTQPAQFAQTCIHGNGTHMTR